MTELCIRKFDITKIRSDSTIFIIGRRASGRTTLVCDILYYKQDIPYGIVISPTEHYQHFYENKLPPPCIFNEYRPEITLNIVKRQKTMKTSAVDPRSFLVMDNCFCDASWKIDASMQQICMNDRDLKLLHILTTSYGISFSSAIRQNIDYVFIFRENVIRNLKYAYEHYANIFPSFESFTAAINALGRYECLVINISNTSNKLEDKVFWYKAKIHKPFMMCCNTEQAHKKRCKKLCRIIRDELYDEVHQNDGLV